MFSRKEHRMKTEKTIISVALLPDTLSKISRMGAKDREPRGVTIDRVIAKAPEPKKPQEQG